MRLKLLTSISLLALAASMAARAQDAKDAKDAKDIPPPIPPLLAPVPEDADWTVTVKYPPEPTPLPHAPKHHDSSAVEVHSTKVGKLKRDLVTSREGVKSEKWFVESLLLWTTPEGVVSVTELSAAQPSDAEDPNPSVSHGFPGVSWIRLEKYVGEVTYQKRRCHHYVTAGMEAWIDVESKLPVAYQSAGALYRFKFNPAPVGPLTMPPAYQKALDAVSPTSSQPS